VESKNLPTYWGNEKIMGVVSLLKMDYPLDGGFLLQMMRACVNMGLVPPRGFSSWPGACPQPRFWMVSYEPGLSASFPRPWGDKI